MKKNVRFYVHIELNSPNICVRENISGRRCEKIGALFRVHYIFPKKIDNYAALPQH
jgi:hypothetical protein